MFTIYSVNSGWGDPNLHCDLKKKISTLRIQVFQTRILNVLFPFLFNLKKYDFLKIFLEIYINKGN